MRVFLILVFSVFVVACSDYQRARSAYEGGDYQKHLHYLKSYPSLAIPELNTIYQKCIYKELVLSKMLAKAGFG